MKKIPENFVKNIKKLDNYLILREEESYLIVATTVTIKEHIEITNNPFSIYSENRDKTIITCFIINFSDNNSLLREFSYKSFIPILLWPHKDKKCSSAIIEKTLDDYMKI